MLSKKTISANGSEIVYNTEYPENANPVTKVRINGRNVESHSKTDSFGRKVFDEIRLGTGFVSRQFSYHAGKVTEEHKQNGKLKSSPTTSLGNTGDGSMCYVPTYNESYVSNNSGSSGTINYSNSQKTKNRYDFWLAELVEKFIPNVYSNDFCIKERNYGIPGINVKIMLAYAFQTNANAVIGWMLDPNAIEISAFFGITDKVSFAISFGVTWTEMYMKFGIGYSPKKSGVFFSLSLTFSISLWVITGIAIACAAIPVLGSFLGTAITAVKSSIAIATPVLVPLIPKVANALL